MARQPRGWDTDGCLGANAPGMFSAARMGARLRNPTAGQSTQRPPLEDGTIGETLSVHRDE